MLPLKARKVIESRSDLKKYLEKVEFLDNLDSIFSNIDSIIIAKNPQSQAELIPSILTYKNIKNFFLEKPLASTPQDSIKLQKILFENKNINVRIAYIFIYCKWFKILESLLDSNNLAEKKGREVRILWTFKAHHFKHNINSWKKDSKNGGGVLNFFAIHVIALIALFDFKLNKVFFKNDECLQSSFIKENILLKIHIDSNANTEIFSISSDNFSVSSDSSSILANSLSISSDNLKYGKNFNNSSDNFSSSLKFKVSSDNPNLSSNNLKVCDNHFNLSNENSILLYQSSSPFESSPNFTDSRIPLLKQHIISITAPNPPYYKWYKKTTTLWQNIQSINI
nr:Gfo/Idh/MocA family oxidoreductase [Helicobacter saguini]